MKLFRAELHITANKREIKDFPKPSPFGNWKLREVEGITRRIYLNIGIGIIEKG